MDKNKISESIKGTMNGAIDAAKKVAKDINVENIKKATNNAIDGVKNAAKKVDLESLKKVANDAANDVKTVAQKVNVDEIKERFVDSFKKKDDIAQEVKPNEIYKRAISTKSSLMIIYFLMAADGEINKNEEDKFNSIIKELDPNYEKNKDAIIKECQKYITNNNYELIQKGVDDSLINTMPTQDAFMTPKLLVWNLLTIAFSDGKYNEIEKKLVNFIVDKTEIDRNIFVELENSIFTLNDIENELNWIKTTDRPYLTIEAVVNELADRKNVIFESVKDLIVL